MKNIVIIGAGLSGIYAATLLQQKINVTIVEARDRIGGRVHTVDGFDMGPSWIWAHQKHILQLIHENNLELFAQYTKGLALYDTPNGVEQFTPLPSAPSARVKGGVIALLKALEEKLILNTIKLNSPVSAIEQQGDHLLVKTESHHYKADIVLNTLPPRLAVETIKYSPELPIECTQTLSNIPTWMGNSAKCTIEFERPFWREKGLSGFAFSHVGPLGEIHDACTDKKAALFGFFNALAPDKSPEAVRVQMQRLFGDDAKQIKNIYITDWTKEPFTSVMADHRPLSAHPNYGYNGMGYDEKLIFMGTESSFFEGGYLEGAVVSANNVAERLIKTL
ncbi:MAG: FAD-dependent oxidoreductase [Helicobacteraceae bacterium]|jgi:monoamine oxidase|nr:FAD-dependent oxidoreductase [Helicobacteraceae bacterium]